MQPHLIFVSKKQTSVKKEDDSSETPVQHMFDKTYCNDTGLTQCMYGWKDIRKCVRWMKDVSTNDEVNK